MVNFCPNCGSKVKQEADFCSNCGYKVSELRRVDKTRVSSPVVERSVFQSKREKILAKREAGFTSKLTKFGIVGGSVAILVIMLIKSLPSKSNPIIENQPVVTSGINYGDATLGMYDIKAQVRDGKIIIPLDIVIEKRLVGFKYEKGYFKVPLLAYISPDGRIVTAISMCEPCNSERFHIENEDMVCNACGTRWELKNLFGVSGACQEYPPDPVPSIVVGNEIQIDEKIVANWKRRI